MRVRIYYIGQSVFGKFGDLWDLTADHTKVITEIRSQGILPDMH